MFSTSKDAQLLRWHKEGCKKDDFIRHPADGAQWHIIDHKYEVFRKGEETFGLHSAVTTPPEIIPYYRLTHSTWSLSDNKEASC
jgi:hypothetical protein